MTVVPCAQALVTAVTDEHVEMIEAIRARDVERADRLAHHHTRQFRDRFLDFLSANNTATMKMSLTAHR